MLYFLFFIKLIIILLFISFLLVYIFKYKIGLIIPITFCVIGLILFFSGLLFNSFKMGLLLIYIISIIGLIVLVKKRKDQIFISKIKTQGLISFIIVIVLVFAYCYKYRFTEWDEYSHWGPMLRTMFSKDSFYTMYPSIGGAHIEYPPFISLIEYFCCILYGFYSETVASVALHILEFSFIIPVIFDIYENRNYIIKTLFSIIIVLSTVLLDAYPVFRTIYIDIPISFLSIYPIIIMSSKQYRETKLYYIPIIVSLMCIMITKQIGIAFVLCDLFLMYYYLFFVDESKKINKLFIVILSLACVISIFWFWNSYVKNFLIVGQFDFNKIIGGVCSKQLSSLQKSTINNFGLYLLNESILEKSITMPYIFLFLFELIVYIIDTFKDNRKEKIGFLLHFLISNLGYLLLLVVLYCFTFSETEMRYLDSLDRYLSSINIYSFIFFMNIVFRDFNINIRNISLVSLVVFLLSFNVIDSLIPRFMINNNAYDGEYTDAQLEVANYISTYIVENEDILVMSHRVSDIVRFSYLTFNKCNFYKNSIHIYDADFMEKITEYDYVIFEYPDMKESIRILSQYCNTDMLYKDVLYKIVKTPNGTQLLMMC